MRCSGPVRPPRRTASRGRRCCDTWTRGPRAWSGGWKPPPAMPTRSPTGWRAAGSPPLGHWPRRSARPRRLPSSPPRRTAGRRRRPEGPERVRSRRRDRCPGAGGALRGVRRCRDAVATVVTEPGRVSVATGGRAVPTGQRRWSAGRPDDPGRLVTSTHVVSGACTRARTGRTRARGPLEDGPSARRDLPCTPRRSALHSTPSARSCPARDAGFSRPGSIVGPVAGPGIGRVDNHGWLTAGGPGQRRPRSTRRISVPAT